MEQSPCILVSNPPLPVGVQQFYFKTLQTISLKAPLHGVTTNSTVPFHIVATQNQMLCNCDRDQQI